MGIQDISRDVLERASAGDPGAFEQVYRSASGFVYNVALRITRNAADAEEVTQDVFMKVHRSLKDFRFRSTFKTWVYRIAANTAINCARKSARERRGLVQGEGVVESLPGQGSAADAVLQDDQEERLQALLGRLSADHRACLVLREIEGLSYQEIAEALRIPVNTVRSRLIRARQALLEETRKGLKNDAV